MSIRRPRPPMASKRIAPGDAIVEDVKIELLGSTILQGDSRRVLSRLPSKSVQCAVTSPPYWGLRDYGITKQIGLEATLPEFIESLTGVFRETRRVLKDDGVLWLNVGDGYTSGNRGWRAPDKKNPARTMSIRPDTPEGLKPKDLLGIPWRLAFALQDDGWFLRSDIIWHKPNAMPESVRDRPSRSHEYLFMLTKGEKYYYDQDAVKENRESGSGKRTCAPSGTLIPSHSLKPTSLHFPRRSSNRASDRAAGPGILYSIRSSDREPSASRARSCGETMSASSYTPSTSRLPQSDWLI